VKFTHRHGKITIGTTKTSNEVMISVKDTGVGIPADKKKKLFKIDSNIYMHGTDNEHGTGLGLKLCKEFTSKLGGKIWVESKENKGSKFIFSIPYKQGE
jgi:signal transduction histidine kinase